ncbi:GntR family transcriptional regulator [Kitasatospora brasiliensis]|uniref:GntR family transcriptional regulator n=1 Tax=Kitasatospora brasiliensis TaxID=3058040 RepID=UPI0029312E39|nr:GntR family transcriptional regulator [Kitasatospora sp. K002]
MPENGAGDNPRPVIHRNSLREQIAGALREEMMAGRLAAGRNFTVKEIADLYGVSATPAREALVDLAAQGLLRAEHHRGFTVPELVWDDFVEIFESRVLITDSFHRQYAARRALPDLTRLPSLHRRADAAVRAARAGNLDVMVGCDRRFWQEVGALLGNSRMAEYLDWLRVQSWMFAARYLRRLPEAGGLCWDRHRELVAAIEVRDSVGAHRIICEYNLFTVRLLAELTGNSPESVTVLGLLYEFAGEEPPEPADPPRTDPPSADRPSADRPSAEPPSVEPPPAARGERGRRGDEVGRELGRELGLGLGLVPQPRATVYGRYGRRAPEQPPETPRGRPDPQAAPGR